MQNSNEFFLSFFTHDLIEHELVNTTNWFLVFQNAYFQAKNAKKSAFQETSFSSKPAKNPMFLFLKLLEDVLKRIV